MIVGDEAPERIDIFRRVDAIDPPGRLPNAEDDSRAANDAYEDRRHRGGTVIKGDE